jgi:phosphoribosylformimino-5-aminoimidazole carboxamide ribotide isomerase
MNRSLSRPLRILPVLDLMGGLVVRGVAGRRQEYAPIVSRLTSSAEPVAVAAAFRDAFGFDELYLADLDAIGGKPPAWDIIAELLRLGFRLWVDAGPGNDHAATLAKLGVQRIIAGLESLAGPEQLRQLVQRHEVVLSLDLFHGRPLGEKTWQGSDSWSIACQAIDLGLTRMLVLDLAAVGVNQGTPTLEFCARLRGEFPFLEIITGGGIRDVGDLKALRRNGVDYALVASALHDGRLTLEELAEFV